MAPEAKLIFHDIGAQQRLWVLDLIGLHCRLLCWRQRWQQWQCSSSVFTSPSLLFAFIVTFIIVSAPGLAERACGPGL